MNKKTKRYHNRKMIKKNVKENKYGSAKSKLSACGTDPNKNSIETNV